MRPPRRAQPQHGKLPFIRYEARTAVTVEGKNAFGDRFVPGASPSSGETCSVQMRCAGRSQQITRMGVETDGNQTNRQKGQTFPACSTCSEARSQPWSEGSPSRHGSGIRAVQHGREVAPEEKMKRRSAPRAALGFFDSVDRAAHANDLESFAYLPPVRLRAKDHGAVLAIGHRPQSSSRSLIFAVSAAWHSNPTAGR